MTETTPRIAIIDYGVGNICNIEKAIRLYSDGVIVTNDPKEIVSADAIILPGVGSFKSGMAGLKIHNLVEPIKKFSKSGKPILGICLGAQLLMSSGFEMGETDGLDLIRGEVRRFPELPASCRIPNMGWRSISLVPEIKGGPILQSLDTNSEMYFVHSYIIIPENKKNVLAIADYGGCRFCAIVGENNVLGAQFHPERSGKEGLVFLENFVKLIPINNKKL